MKSFGSLFAISRRFYLCILAIVTLFVFTDCVYMCNDCGISLTRTGVEQYVENTLTREEGISVLEYHYVDFAGEIVNKGNNGTLIGLLLTIAGIIILLYVREISFADSRTREFRFTWPVKSWIREIYDYLAMLVVILFGGVLETVILWVTQKRYHELLLEVLEQQAITSRAMEFISQSDQRLFTSMVCYMVCIVVTYTWIYLGMSLTRNALAGAVLALVVKGSLVVLWSTFAWSIVEKLTGASGEDYTAMNVAYLVEEVGLNILSNSVFFFNLDLNQTLDGGFNVFTITHWVIVQVVICFLMITGIIISAKKKDLSKGKLLYFPILDYPFVIITGLFISVFFVETFWWDVPESGFVIAVVSAIIIFILIHPFSKKNTQRLEVK